MDDCQTVEEQDSSFRRSEAPSIPLQLRPALAQLPHNDSVQSNKAMPDSSCSWNPSMGASAELLGGWGESMKRTCRICYRQFSSGRALGGHMRVHGPLFQPAGSKRKLSCSAQSGQGKPFELHLEHQDMDMSFSNQSDLSCICKRMPFQAEKLTHRFKCIGDGIALGVGTHSENHAVAEDVGKNRTYHLQPSDSRAISDYDDDEHDVDAEDSCRDFEEEEEYDPGDSIHDGNGHLGKGGFISPDSAAMENLSFSHPSKRTMYKLRRNPKKSRRFEEDDLAMDMFLAEQASSSLHPHSKGSVFSSLQRPRHCSECGKSFWSWKALFGHMRCHPERLWRGILPPEDAFVEEEIGHSSRKKLFAEGTELVNSNHELECDTGKKGPRRPSDDECKKPAILMLSEEEATEHVIDDAEDVKGGAGSSSSGFAEAEEWKPRWLTGKRSRRRAESLQRSDVSTHGSEQPALTSESGSLEEPAHQDEEEETPNFLLMLAEAARKVEDCEHVQGRSQSAHFEESAHRHHFKGDQKLLRLSAKPISTQDASSCGGGGGGCNTRYECSTCKKSFSSHQALGGHRASHKKMKGFSEDVRYRDNDLNGEEPWETGLRVASNSQPPSSSHGNGIEKNCTKHRVQIKGHECSICHRIFPTGQALGGHKRCHYMGERAAEAAASFSSSNKQLCEEAHSSKLDDGIEDGTRLDLNLPASADDVGGEVADAPGESSVVSLDNKEKQRLTDVRSLDERLSLDRWMNHEVAEDRVRSSPWELKGSWTVGPTVA